MAKEIRNRVKKVTKGKPTWHTHRPLSIGDHVSIQNQHGNKPKIWSNTGKIVEVLPYRKFQDMMDGSRRVTLRNRRFLRKIPSSVKDREEPIPPPANIDEQGSRNIEYLKNSRDTPKLPWASPFITPKRDNRQTVPMGTASPRVFTQQDAPLEANSEMVQNHTVPTSGITQPAVPTQSPVPMVPVSSTPEMGRILEVHPPMASEETMQPMHTERPAERRVTPPPQPEREEIIPDAPLRRTTRIRKPVKRLITEF